VIVVRMEGGLGNQMFQYAAGLSLARRNGVSLRLDLSAIRADPKRTFMLNEFGIEGDDLFSRLCLALWRMGRTRFVEPYFQYCENFESQPGNLYLEGYWQSPRYFPDLHSELQKLFVPAEPASVGMLALLRAMEDSDSVGIHVRRGDYVQDPATNAFHGVCGQDYYRAALQVMQQRVPDARLFVFTDDPEWVVAELDLGVPFKLVSGRAEMNTTQEWWLMSRCKHQVIANSSFSWWAAWLGEQQGKVAVAPKRWFADETIDTCDLIPQEWLRL
jgi:hypothetical protein